MNSSTKALRLENVSRHYDGVKAVDDVSLSLPPGETLALVGPNGAGKSTLIQLISGVASLTSGRIWLEDRRIDKLPPERIARLGIGRSFQTSRVFPALTVWDSVMLGTQARLLAEERASGRLKDPFSELFASLLGTASWRRRLQAQEAVVQDILQLFGERLWPRRHQPAYTLSYANRRRLEIARVLAGQPDYLLLDEPAAGMNPTETAELTELLLQLRRLHPQLGILVVEHKLSLVRQVADRVIVLNQGQILAEGDPDEALDHPEVVEAYLGRVRTRPVSSDAHLG
ncbi:ABC transporter ATP-binding protein [Pusillimonas sp. CC-YST705]|uniref:ABC transporter ATP-binding protein n=1 Tax=Mesopusillimonas faecipullorum TaxID=2755040 RepID=A0ABS8CDB0_9BURK|nr:ABC transporter ATP-binding protein [Mesopusillimonas faecipullorum]MCB5363594.1 ABC transporter ATP-binding protein [Mesopusillimonas faecipullorum]